MAARRTRSYRSGLFAGWAHAKLAADTLDVAPTADDVATIGAPSDLSPEQYRAGYVDGLARYATGMRSPRR